MSSNQYYLHLDQDREPIPLNTSEIDQISTPELSYFSKVLEAAEKRLEVDGLVFYLTRLPWRGKHELPSYGKNVVAIILKDEWYRIPTYSHKVRTVFKCYGSPPVLGCNPVLRPSYINFLSLVQFLKIYLFYLPGWLKFQLYKFKGCLNCGTDLNTANISSIHPIPLGYYKQLDLPIKSIKDRQYDIFFDGSVVNRIYPVWSLKHWIDTPKSLSRKKMLTNLKKIQKKHPGLKIELSITSNFRASSCNDSNHYSKKMMDAKICLVPRGTTLETHRFFEALRYGCVLVTENLPSRWFYDGSPAIQVKDWNDLEKALEKLIVNESCIQEKHQESLSWWQDKCSEAAVGAYIAEKLNEHSR